MYLEDRPLDVHSTSQMRLLDRNPFEGQMFQARSVRLSLDIIIVVLPESHIDLFVGL